MSRESYAPNGFIGVEIRDRSPCSSLQVSVGGPPLVGSQPVLKLTLPVSSFGWISCSDSYPKLVNRHCKTNKGSNKTQPMIQVALPDVCTSLLEYRFRRQRALVPSSVEQTFSRKFCCCLE